MKTRIIEIPEGFEITEFSKTKIVVTEIVKKLPMAFKELGRVSGFYVNNTSSVHRQNDVYAVIANQNIFPTQIEAEASLALSQLCQLRNAWNDGWIANYSDTKQEKFIIANWDNNLIKEKNVCPNCILSFKTQKLRDDFFICFKDLIEIAKPFL